jgi:hypothetical protein
MATSQTTTSVKQTITTQATAADRLPIPYSVAVGIFNALCASGWLVVERAPDGLSFHRKKGTNTLPPFIATTLNAYSAEIARALSLNWDAEAAGAAKH